MASIPFGHQLCSKFREQRDAGPESMTMHLESRFEQLRVACELELWGEAFRSVEDIQQLIALTKKVRVVQVACRVKGSRVM